MKRLFYGSMLMFGLLVMAQPSSYITGTGGDSVVSGAVRGGSVLFSTFGGIAPMSTSITSQNFTDVSLGGFTTAAADDFTIPAGETWSISELQVEGAYFSTDPGFDPNDLGPADSVNVYILGNSGSLPDTTNLSAGSIFALENASFNDVGTGDFNIPLPGSGILLPPGTYWLVVQVNMETLVNGQWGWRESSAAPDTGTIVGFESAWMQNMGFIVPGCINAWGARITTCGLTIAPPNGTSNEHDLAFQVVGDILLPGVTVAPLSIITSEPATSSFFNVVLDAPPAAGETVTVPLGTPPVAEGMIAPASLMFNAANWDISQMVTVTPVDDLIAEATAMYTLMNGPTSSGDLNYNGLAVDNVDVSNFDDDSAGISVTPVSGLIVSEDGTLTASFDVSANTPPTDDVMVPISVDPSLATLSTAMVTLPSGSTAAVMVTVTGVDNDIDDGDLPFTVVTADPTSTGDAVYDALGAADVADVTGTTTDDDTAGITVTLSGPAPLVTDEDGASSTFDIVLDSEPTVAVTINLESSDSSEGLPDLASVVFTPANWDTAQTVTVTGEDDDIDDGNVLYNINTDPAVSADPVYSGLDAAEAPFINNDNGDVAGFVVAPVNNLITTEAGATDTFNVRLSSEPIFDVTIPFSSDDLTEGTISNDEGGPDLTLTFTAADWDVNQVITVTGVDDAIADGDVVYNIVGGDPTSFDPTYDAFGAADVPDVEVTNLETPGKQVGFVVVPISGLTTTEGGGTDSFNVRLTSEPLQPVTLPISSSDLSEGSVSTPSLVFDNTNWNIDQTVTVTGVDDFLIDGDIAYTIITGDPSSADPAYDALIDADVDDVGCTNLNDDICEPVNVDCQIGGPMTVTGLPGCFIDVYDSNGSSNPADWTLITGGVLIPASGSVLIPGLICQPDTNYIITAAGDATFILNTFRTVPTLGQWGLIAFVLLLMAIGVYTLRRRRLA